uniref:DUF4411 family protein n=1 Tax=Candidatus Kentrum sp. LFY TaxID=2126342 RepID=A0A450UEF9_9GAMM|nr:MAG: protein of unknown function (DUF4411) [Candidatus Kentron sp. LFY]VFK14242.1 MAG: protein of unknown function (DUF4411) [Candidatus Kentron sp. LFY]
MTTYVFDTGPFILLFRHYYPKRFPSLWEQFHEMVAGGRITSTREVYNELEGQEDALSNWCKANREVFGTPTTEQLDVVKKILEINHFRALISKQKTLQGKPVADPFVIALAKCLENSCVVTSETKRDNAAKIPNVCEHFKVYSTNLEGFMEREDWRF